MAKYIKQQCRNKNVRNEEDCFYRMERVGTISTNEFVEMVAHPGSGVSKGTVMQVLDRMIFQLSAQMAKGYAVNIEGLGRFHAAIALHKDKMMDSIDDNGVKRNSASIGVDNIKYHADRAIINHTESLCSLTRGNVNRLCISPYTKEQRLKLAIDYLSDAQHKVMKISDYMDMTKLSKTKAQLELVEFRENSETGIGVIGVRNHILYTLL